MDKIEELENRLGILERRFNVAILALNEVLREFEKVKKKKKKNKNNSLTLPFFCAIIADVATSYRA